MRRRNRSQGGAALLLVIWVVALLSLLAATALQITAATAHIAEAGIARARLQAAADGAINLALLEMIDSDSKSRWPVDGTTRTLMVGGQSVTISIQDEAGKVDVNRAPDALLKAVFVAAGAGADDVGKWAKALDGRRDDPGKGGEAVMQSHMRGAAPIRTVDEVADIAAIPSVAFRCVRPALTVYTGLQGVDRRYVAAAFRRALTGSGDAGNDPASAIVDNDSFAGRVFSVEATASSEGARFARHLVLRISGDPDRPYLIGLWGGDVGEDADSACQ